MKWNLVLFKATTWRIIATLTTTLIAFAITGQWIMALEIGLIEFLIKIIAFYFHERIWEKVG